MEGWLPPGEVLQGHLQLLLVNFSSYHYRSYLFPTTNKLAGNNTYVPETPCIQFFGAKVADKPLVQQILGMSVLISNCCFRPQKGRHRGRQPLPSIIQSPCPYGKSDFQGISKDQNISFPAVFGFCSLGEPNIKNQLYAQRKFKSHMPRKRHRLGKIQK